MTILKNYYMVMKFSQYNQIDCRSESSAGFLK